MIGQTISHYRITAKLGEGGMGEVYLATDTSLDRKVALKFLPSSLQRDPEARERLIREAKAASKLNHPHILTIHAVERSGERDFIVMEFVEGQTLSEHMRSAECPVPQVLDWAIQIADGLAWAHRHGTIHRDIKPDNIMIAAHGQLKITDFGLARQIDAALLTQAGSTVGTASYMSPEQARGEVADHRSDIWSLGVLLYESLAGVRPFAGSHPAAVMYAVIHENPRPISELRAGTPPELAQIIMRCLEKEAADRFQSAAELVNDLRVLSSPGSAISQASPPAQSKGRRTLVTLAAGMILALAVWIGWKQYSRYDRVQWAQTVAIPKIRELADSADVEAAYNLALEAGAVIPDDPQLAALWKRVSQVVSIATDPAGARTFRRPFTDADTVWQYLGVTPLDSTRVPLMTPNRWYVRFEKEGFVPLEILASGFNAPYVLSDTSGVNVGMVRVPGATMRELNLPGLEQFGGVSLDTFWIGRHEVTNREFKRFVEGGGYRNPEYWPDSLQFDGHTLPWEEAATKFTDRTGRAGPSTWEAGDFPAGQADYPVSGLSWYEAQAYARFVGQSLPTVYHWVRAAGTTLAANIIPRSNYSGDRTAAVGSYRGVGPFGTVDMAGNVREWCANSNGSAHYILGGGWNDPGYGFQDAYAQPPFDRSPTNGLRLVRYRSEDTTLATLGRTLALASRDYSRERPVGDEIFSVYRRLFDYDKTPLNGAIESTDSSAEDFFLQRVSFAAAYGGERVTGYLFLPKRSQPPFQTIVHFPGSNALTLREFNASQWLARFDFIIKSGRAVFFPVYKSTFERGDGYEVDIASESNAYRDHVIMWAKDFRRSLDYLATRTELATSRVAYYGHSWGGVMGGIIPAVEPRIRCVVLSVAGLEFQRSLPEVETLNFLPRITIPVLMLNGRHDHYFPLETSQRPFFQFLGTPGALKRHVVSDGGHFVPRNQAIAETLDWLDRYLGPVR